MSTAEPRMIVGLLGARRDYLVPRILHQAGMLETFYTDIVSSRGWPRLFSVIPNGWQPQEIRRLVGREPRLPNDMVRAFPTFALRYFWRRRRAKCPDDLTRTYLWAGQEFCRLVLEEGFGAANAVHTFNTAGLEILREAKNRGLFTISEQTIAPYRIESEILHHERALFPHWEGLLPSTSKVQERYQEREEREWDFSDVILCGSEYVRSAIGAIGGPVERCVVVPYSHGAKMRPRKGKRKDGPLRVLFVGEVGLRKGAPYVMDAAKRLKGQMEFRLVGKVSASPSVLDDLKLHATVTGAVPRDEMNQHYQWADVFLLPSLCEGSASATYEALASGLPVICTPNTGSVVRDGIEGFIVPTRDGSAIQRSLVELARDPTLRDAMATAASKRAGEFDIPAYTQTLLAAITRGFRRFESVPHGAKRHTDG